MLNSDCIVVTSSDSSKCPGSVDESISRYPFLQTFGVDSQWRIPALERSPKQALNTRRGTLLVPLGRFQMTKSARSSIWKRRIIPELGERCIFDNDAWAVLDLNLTPCVSCPRREFRGVRQRSIRPLCGKYRPPKFGIIQA